MLVCGVGCGGCAAGIRWRAVVWWCGYAAGELKAREVFGRRCLYRLREHGGMLP